MITLKLEQFEIAAVQSLQQAAYVLAQQIKGTKQEITLKVWAQIVEDALERNEKGKVVLIYSTVIVALLVMLILVCIAPLDTSR